MSGSSTPNRSLPLSFWLAVGVILILLLSLWIFQMVMHPTSGDLRLMALFLAITALISGLAAYGASRLGWSAGQPFDWHC
jgi:bacteriorhodopsin